MNDYKEILKALGYLSEQQQSDVFRMLAEDGELEHRLTMKDLKRLAHLTRSLDQTEGGAES